MCRPTARDLPQLPAADSADGGFGALAKISENKRFNLSLRPAEAEELRAVGGRKGHRLVGAVIGDAGGIRDPGCRSRQRADLVPT